MEDKYSKIIEKTSTSIKGRRKKIIWIHLCLFMLFSTLIWTVEPPVELLELNPWVYLFFVSLPIGMLIINEKAVKNEKQLLNLLRHSLDLVEVKDGGETNSI